MSLLIQLILAIAVPIVVAVVGFILLSIPWRRLGRTTEQVTTKMLNKIQGPENEIAGKKAEIEEALAEADETFFDVRTSRRQVLNKVLGLRTQRDRWTVASDDAARRAAAAKTPEEREEWLVRVQEALRLLQETENDLAPLEEQRKLLEGQEEEAARAVKVLGRRKATLAQLQVNVRTAAVTDKTGERVRKITSEASKHGQVVERARKYVETMQARSDERAQMAKEAAYRESLRRELEALAGVRAKEIDIPRQAQVLIAKYTPALKELEAEEVEVAEPAPATPKKKG